MKGIIINTDKLLLSYKFKKIGWLLVFIGVVLALIRFYLGIKPEFLNMKVFAFYSFYIEAKTFTVIQNHVTEELAAIFLLTGLFILVLSKEKEENEFVNKIRLNSLIISIFLNTILLIISVFFTFGFAFVGALVLNMFSLMIIYLIIFKWNYRKYKIKSTT